MQGKVLRNYDDEMRKRPDVPGTDSLLNPINQGVKQEFITFQEMLSVKEKFDRQLGVVSTPTVDGGYIGTGEVQHWSLVYKAPDGRTYTTPAGDIWAEMSNPFGWAERDKEYYYIGMDGAGSLKWRAVLGMDGGIPAMDTSGSTLPFEFAPEKRPDPPPPPAVGSTTTILPNGGGPGFLAGFTQFDHDVLVRVNKWLDSIGVPK